MSCDVRLYGYRITTVNTFLTVPSAPKKVVESRSFVTELTYPRSLPGLNIGDVAEKRSPRFDGSTPPSSSPGKTPGGRTHPPFCQVLYNSLCKESKSRGWCEQTEAYEPIKQVPLAARQNFLLWE